MISAIHSIRPLFNANPHQPNQFQISNFIETADLLDQKLAEFSNSPGVKQTPVTGLWGEPAGSRHSDLDVLKVIISKDSGPEQVSSDLINLAKLVALNFDKFSGGVRKYGPKVNIEQLKYVFTERDPVSSIKVQRTNRLSAQDIKALNKNLFGDPNVGIEIPQS